MLIDLDKLIELDWQATWGDAYTCESNGLMFDVCYIRTPYGVLRERHKETYSLSVYYEGALVYEENGGVAEELHRAVGRKVYGPMITINRDKIEQGRQILEREFSA